VNARHHASQQAKLLAALQTSSVNSAKRTNDKLEIAAVKACSDFYCI